MVITTEHLDGQCLDDYSCEENKKKKKMAPAATRGSPKGVKE